MRFLSHTYTRSCASSVKLPKGFHPVTPHLKSLNFVYICLGGDIRFAYNASPVFGECLPRTGIGLVILAEELNTACSTLHESLTAGLGYV